MFFGFREPSDAPTESPNVSPGTLECGSQVDGYLYPGDEKIFDLTIGLETEGVLISTCFGRTNFRTFLVLSDSMGDEIANDTDSCGSPGFQSLIDIPDGLAQGSYQVSLTAAQPGGNGTYRISVICRTADPTADPTTSAMPTMSPTTAQPTVDPTNLPSEDPTERPTAVPTIEPTVSVKCFFAFYLLPI